MYCHANLEDINVIKSHINSWGSLSPEDLRFERLAGLSNEIWKVTAASAEARPSSVVFRRFGEESSAIADREKEDYILKGLSSCGVGPKIYGGNKELRIEKFYESRTLDPSDVEKEPIKRQIAKCLAELHNVQMGDLDKTAAFDKIINIRGKRLIKKAQEKAKKDIYKPEERKMLDEMLTLTSSEEIAFLRTILPKDPKSVVFSHNDLHALNILMLEKTNKLILIDYEYSDYNYRGYDIANLFNEGLFDYSASETPFFKFDESKYPSDQEIFDFVKYYLFFYKFELSGPRSHLVLEDEAQLIKYIEDHYKLEKFFEEVAEIVQEVKICSLFSHYHWIMWSIIMSKGTSSGALDHIYYGYKRYQTYQSIKRKLFDRNSSQVSVSEHEQN